MIASVLFLPSQLKEDHVQREKKVAMFSFVAMHLLRGGYNTALENFEAVVYGEAAVV